MSTKPGTLSTMSGRLSTCSVKRLSTTSGNKQITVNQNQEKTRDLFIEKTEIFKHAAPDTRFKRIWHYVEEHDYKMIADGEIIINERLNDFDFITIHQKLLDFCNYEKEKINSILKS